MVHYKHKKIEAVRLTIKLPSELNDYAKAFLAIFNNVREYPDRLLKVENNSTNYVFVTVRKDCVKDAKDYLSNWGEITMECTVNVFEISAEYDFNGYHELYEERDGETIDAEFIVNVE